MDLINAYSSLTESLNNPYWWQHEIINDDHPCIVAVTGRRMGKNHIICARAARLHGNIIIVTPSYRLADQLHEELLKMPGCIARNNRHLVTEHGKISIVSDRNIPNADHILVNDADAIQNELWSEILSKRSTIFAIGGSCYRLMDLAGLETWKSYIRART